MEDLRAVLKDVFAALGGYKAIRAIGVSGGTEFPKSGEGDVDVFLYCESIPDAGERERAFGALFEEAQFGFFESELWGARDRAVVRGTEVFLMYFTREQAIADARSVLECRREAKEGSFYPTGRLAMYKGMREIYDPDGFLSDLKRLVSVYPNELARKQIDWARDRLRDCEGLNHSAARRDLAGYHAFLDEQIEAAFVALFAVNRAYYPSRKRNLSISEGFALLPESFSARFREAVRLGASEESIPESLREWEKLAEDILTLIQSAN